MATVYADVRVDESEVQYDNPVDNPALYELAVSENPMYSTASKPAKGHRRTKSQLYPPPEEGVLYDDRVVAEQQRPKTMHLETASSTEEPDYLQTS